MRIAILLKRIMF